MWKKGDIIIRAASSNDELEAIFRLRYQNYLRMGYVSENPSMMMCDAWDKLAETTHLVALCGRHVVGAVRMIADSKNGLPMERVFPEEIDTLRNGTGGLAEASALVTACTNHRPDGNLWLRLSRHLFAEARSRQVDNLCIAVTENHVSFYQRVLFEKIGAGKHYKSLNNVFAYPLRLRIKQVKMKHKATDTSPIISLQDLLIEPQTPTQDE